MARHRDIYEENVFFVQVVEKYPVIYNHFLPEHAIREEVEKAWKAVAEEVQADVAICKLKWKCCRSSYAHYVRQVATRDTKPKVYYLAKYMKYLDPFSQFRKYSLGTAANDYEHVSNGQPDDNTPDDIDSYHQNSDAEVEDIVKQEGMDAGEINGTTKNPNVVILGTFSAYQARQSKHFGDEDDQNEIAYIASEEEDSNHIVTEVPKSPWLLPQSLKYAKKRAVLPNVENAENSSHIECKRKYSESDTENADYLFLKSLLPDIAQLTPSQKSRFKLFVMDKLNSMLYGSSE